MNSPKTTKATCIVKLDNTEFEIRVDKDGLACLTEIWRRAHSPDARRPKDWLSTKEAKEFIEHIKEVKGEDSPLFNVTPGRNGGTYANLQITLKYAQWLSPNFQEQVNDVFIQHREEQADPELGIVRSRQRAVAEYQRRGMSGDWINSRLKGIEKRCCLTEAMKEQGITENKFYAIGTNAVYKVLLGGTANNLKDERNLPRNAVLRDHLDQDELEDIQYAETLAARRIRQQNKLSGWQAVEHSGKAAEIVKAAVANALAA